MNHHPVSFVEDEEVLVFENYVKRDVLRSGLCRDGFWDGHGNEITGFYGVTGLRGLPIAENILLADELLDAGSREFVQTGC